MPRKKQETGQHPEQPLDGGENRDHFRALVRDCIAAYTKFTNDRLSLDFCRVTDKKIRAMVLADEEYRSETRNIYARQRLEEIEEIDRLARMASREDEEDGDTDAGDIESADPRNGKKGKKKPVIDKDRLNMLFKAAQMRREIRADMSSSAQDVERDAVNLMWVGVSRGDIETSIRDDIYEGDDEGSLDELIDRKEDVPEGTGGKVRGTGEAVPPDDEDFFDVLPDGEIVER
jgi:hypothetical protein